MLEERMAVVERCLPEAERRDVEAGKLRHSSVKSNRERRSPLAEYLKKEESGASMALDLKLFEQDAGIYEQTVLDSGRAVTENETTSKKNRLLEMVGKSKQSTETKYEPDTTQWKVTIDDGASEVATLCEKDEDFTSID
ncbi:hypothetical protein G7Y79_00060g092120 [Physcia stellaris]|nr:hypothetical protein G7Y79_00060g092120 [Physcia stellaris]